MQLYYLYAELILILATIPKQLYYLYAELILILTTISAVASLIRTRRRRAITDTSHHRYESSLIRAITDQWSLTRTRRRRVAICDMQLCFLCLHALPQASSH